MNEYITLKNAAILTLDEKDSFYEKGILVIKGKRIEEIGNMGEVEEKGLIIDMKGRLIMPGLINTHTHSHSSLFKNQADDLELMDWLKLAMWPMEKFLSQERSYAATRLSCLEYIKSGITTYADQFYYAEQTARAASESGLRCHLAATVFTNPSPETDDTYKAAEDFIVKWYGKQEETRVYPCIGPHAPYSVDGELFKKVIALAEKYDLLIHTHISETEDENRQIKEQYGVSPTKWLNSLGFFKQKVLAAHSVHLDEEDLEIYRKNKVYVTYNPVSNLKLVSGIMPLKEMWEKGIAVTLGTDGAQSNNSMDLLRDLRTGVLIQKQKNKDATFFDTRQAIRMVTTEGAKALGMENEIGSLVVSKRADLIAFDTTSPRICPLHTASLKNLYATIVYSACGADVSDSMVDGKWVMRNYQVLTYNEEEVRKQAQEASEYIVSHADIRMR